MSRPTPGEIVVVDYRGGRIHAEPGGLRPSVLVESGLFPEEYPNAIVVPLTRDRALAYADFAVQIDPAPDNGAEVTCWALSHHVTTVAIRRVHSTASRVSPGQLRAIRMRVAAAVGAP